MTRVYIADALSDERSALRLMLQDLKMELVGESSDWAATLADAPATRLDMLLLEWDLLPAQLAVQAVAKLREACLNSIVVVMLSRLDIRQQAAQSAGADVFISKSDTPELVSIHLRLAAAKVHPI